MPTDPTTPPADCCPTCMGTGEITDANHVDHPRNTGDGADETWCIDCDGDGSRMAYDRKMAERIEVLSYATESTEPPPAPRRDGEDIANAVQFRRLKPGDNFRFLHSPTPYEKKDGHGRYGTPGSEGHIAIAHPSAPVLPLEKENAPRRDGDAMPAVDEAVAAILTVRDYLTASGAGTETMRAFIGIVATWKRDRDERDTLAKRCERAEAYIEALATPVPSMTTADEAATFSKAAGQRIDAARAAWLAARAPGA